MNTEPKLARDVRYSMKDYDPGEPKINWLPIIVVPALLCSIIAIAVTLNSLFTH